MKERLTNYILAFDQGTTSCRALIFDRQAQIVSIAQEEFTQIYPQPGWVEHNAIEIWEKQLKVAGEAINKAGISSTEIAGIGITNQRETVVVWDKKTGIPVYNAIVWQDRRTAERCEALKKDGYSEQIHAKTGLVIDAYFSATKIEWILNHVRGAKMKAANGELLAGTIDSWMIWRLTKGEVFATDFTNASRTMLYHIKNKVWDTELLDLFGIPQTILPKVKLSAQFYGTAHKKWFGTDIPISGVAGDQQASTFGQLCFDEGMVKNTYGTGCFMLMNIGSEYKQSDNGLLTTLICNEKGEPAYGFEGSVFIAGSAIKWLRDGLGIIKSASETEQMAMSLKSNAGVYFVPAFTGLGTPYWDMDARGVITGLTQGVNKNHIVRAALESIAFQTKDVLDIMETESEVTISSLRVDGGAVVNNFLMQFQSDILNTQVVRPKVIETTALGAAYLSGLAIGFWSIDEIKGYYQVDSIFSPLMDDKLGNTLYKEWKMAVDKSRLR